MQLRGVYLAGAMLLVGCATPYQERGFSGGVTANRVTSDQFQISARGNGFTSPELIQRYVLRKAAEATLSAGYDMFVIESRQDRSSTQYSSVGGSGFHNGVFISSYTTVPIFKPGETVWIRALKYPKPADLNGVFDAKEVLSYLVPATADRKTCSEVEGVVKCE